MQKQKNKKLVIVILLVLQLLQMTSNLFCVQANINLGDTINLKEDHKCDSLLQYCEVNSQKWIYKELWYFYCIDKKDKEKCPAFCMETEKRNFTSNYELYDVEVDREKNKSIWRILEKGYMGSNYKIWNLENDDDFYVATNIALHSLLYETAPKDKYILGNTSIDGNTVEEIQRRGKKVLEVAQTLYEYGISGTQTLTTPQISITKKGKEIEQNIQNINYYIQTYEVKANKNLKSYEVEIQNFPTGTKILNSQNKEQIEFSENFFKIAIPINQIKEDIKGNIQIRNAKLQTNTIFHCRSYSKETQNYVTYTTNYEILNTSIVLEIKSNTCSLQIEKIDKQTKKPIANVTFEIRDEKSNKIAKVTTNEKGIAELNNIYHKTITIKEIKVPEPYILSNEEKQVELQMKKTSTVIFENEKKSGKIEIHKVDKQNNEIKLENVEFELLDENHNIVEKLITDKNGYAISKEHPIGEYYIKEVKTNENYILDNKEIKIQIKHNEMQTLNLQNEPIKKVINEPKLPRTGF